MKNVVATGVAILLGLVSVYLVHSYIQSKLGTKISTVAVVAAAQKIDAGTKIEERLIAKRELEERALPPGYIPAQSFPEVLGRELQFAAKTGDPILWSMLRAEVERASDLVPMNYRAVTFSVSNVGSVANQIQPGDMVDIFCTIKTTKEDVKIEGHTIIGGDGKPLQAIETMLLLTKVKVMSVDFRTNRKATAGYQESEMFGYGNLTVIATPEECEAIIFTQGFAALHCVLRNPKDPVHPLDVGPLDLSMYKEMLQHIKKRRSQTE